MGNLGGWEIVIILGVLVLLFGAKRLPDMARSLGQSARVLKGEMKGLKNEDHPEAGPATTPRPAQSVEAPRAHIDSMSAEQLRAEADRIEQLQAHSRPANPSGATGQ